MDALADYGSDESSSSSSSSSSSWKHNKEKSKPQETFKTAILLPSTPLKRPCIPQQQVQQQQREVLQQQVEVQAEQVQKELFSSPQLDQNESMISWSRDFTVPYRTIVGTTSSNELTLFSLTTQNHEFSNPSFFGTMVQHFGIMEPLKTNEISRREVLEDYEFHLLAIEEMERRKQTERE